MSESQLGHCRQAVAAQLRARLQERAPGRVQLLTGPRQVGKTTLLLELAGELPNAVYYAVDSPEAALPGWWEAIWQEVSRRFRRAPAVVLLDEIHYLDHWDRLVKSKADQIHREKLPFHIVVSGSSALRVGRGLKETMAGRFEKLELSHWSAADLQSAFGLTAQQAVSYLVQWGSYPGAFPLRADAARWRSYMRDSIIEPAIGRDIMMLEPVRKPALLRQLFLVSAGHPAEIVSLQKLAGELQSAGAQDTLAHYLHVLEQAYLVVGLEKFSARAIRRRAAPPKLVVLNNALMAAMHDVSPSHPRWGAWVENACLAHAWNRGQEVYYWREEPLEVDGVFVGSWGKWAVEIKTGNFGLRELGALLEFCRRYPQFHPLVLCAADRAGERLAGVPLMSWADFLLGKNLP